MKRLSLETELQRHARDSRRGLGGSDVSWGPAEMLPPAAPARIRRVVTIHDLNYLRFARTMHPPHAANLRFMIPRSVRAADRIIAVSSTTLQVPAQIAPGPARRRTVAILEGVFECYAPCESTASSAPSFSPSVAWSPAKIFERSSRLFSGLQFNTIG